MFWNVILLIFILLENENESKESEGLARLPVRTRTWWSVSISIFFVSSDFIQNLMFLEIFVVRENDPPRAEFLKIFWSRSKINFWSKYFSCFSISKSYSRDQTNLNVSQDKRYNNAPNLLSSFFS